jgi:hypothetical protein
MSSLRIMAITAATWPCGNERRISTASPDWLTTAPPLQEHAQTVDQRRRQLAEIGDGPLMDPLAPDTSRTWTNGQFQVKTSV